MNIIKTLVYNTLKDTYCTLGTGDYTVTCNLKDREKERIASCLSAEACYESSKEMRRYGKTTLMIKLADVTGYPLICYNPRAVKARVNELGLKNIKLFSFKELKGITPCSRVLVDDLIVEDIKYLKEELRLTPIGFVLVTSNKEKTPLDIVLQVKEDADYILNKCTLVYSKRAKISDLKNRIAESYEILDGAKLMADSSILEDEKEYKAFYDMQYNNRAEEFFKLVELYNEESTLCRKISVEIDEIIKRHK